MAIFSDKSKKLLSECHNDLQVLFNEVIKKFDCTVVTGYRGKEAQEKAFKDGASKLHYPNSKHNKIPSSAIDVMPYPINYKNISQQLFFAGHVMCLANILFEKGLIKHKIRWGGDWNMNNNPSDESFHDNGHFEIIK